MIAECAVDPEVMAHWSHFQSLHGDFGVGQARVLCEFPKKWRRMVLQRAAEVEADYTGFVIGDEFVVGYGLDYQGRYRNLPYVGVLKEECI